ncbi:MAG TPA: hypothetical protein VEC11_12285 [Allosphingosinicella sp.]|nr:hypothetical protein [Allosphingosinicella sp.]
MVIILTAFLAAAQSLPIDRTALELQSRAEALQPRSRGTAPARPAPRKPAAQPTRTATARPQTVRPGPTRQIQPGPTRRTQSASANNAARRSQPRRATSGGPLDLASITTICRAAGNQDDPAGFIARLSTAYSLSDADSVSLRASCAAYLAGRADARRAGGGTY